MTPSFAVTFDYRCPFARNAHEAVVRAQRDQWDVQFTFQAFSLDQVHVEEGDVAVWERPPDQRGTGVLALEWGIAVRDTFSAHFVDFHLATFAARHDHGRPLADPQVLQTTAAGVGLDPEAVAAEVASGRPLTTLAREHTEAVDRWSAFGVPTFISADAAVFIRFMDRGRTDDLERALALFDAPRINEFKHTRLPR